MLCIRNPALGCPLSPAAGDIRMLADGGALVLQVAENSQHPPAPVTTNNNAQLETAAVTTEFAQATSPPLLLLLPTPHLPSSFLPACAVPPTGDSGADDCWDPRSPLPLPPQGRSTPLHLSPICMDACQHMGLLGHVPLGIRGPGTACPPIRLRQEIVAVFFLC